MSETAAKLCERCAKPLEGWQTFGQTCDACDIAIDAADPVTPYSFGEPFTALYQGQRYRFQVLEHFNIGPGWMCGEMDGSFSGIVGSHLLADVKPA